MHFGTFWQHHPYIFLNLVTLIHFDIQCTKNVKLKDYRLLSPPFFYLPQEADTSIDRG